MATKKTATKSITIEPIKKTLLSIELIGDSDLILNKKARSYELPEVWKQSHDKGTPMPKMFTEQHKNPWEVLITSIHWLNPIEFHDDDWSKYTEEEWKYYMENNKPCILPNAWCGSFMETFVTFCKDSTGKNGTDFKRAVNITKLTPVSFASARTEQKLVPNTGQNKTNVIAQYNVFSGWSCTIEVSVADIVFPYETVLTVVQAAGEFVGIGTQRKNGYGRYHIGNIVAS